MNRRSIVLGAIVAGLGLAQPVLAGDSNGNFQVKVGVTGVVWQDENKGILSSALGPVAGADAHAKDIVLPTLTLTYFLNRNIAAELFCCFAHANVHTTGTLKTAFGQDKVADTWTFPPILTLQWRFEPIGAFRPYVGAGVQWIHYFNSDSGLTGAFAAYNRVRFEDSWGLALQAGLDVDLGRGWSVGLDVKKVFEDTRITWTDPASGATITTRHDLDPWFLTANIGYRFNLEDLLGRRSAPAPLK